MTPQELQDFLLRYGFDATVAVVAAGVVVVLLLKYFVPGYLSEKGKNLATREDFAILLDQVKQTTKETAIIKTELLSRNWVNQQHWSFREKYYMGILEHLTILQSTLLDRKDYYLEPGSEHNDKPTDTEHFRELTLRGSESYRTIRELVGPASVFLSDKSTSALRKLISEHWNVAYFSSCTAEYLDSSLKLVDAAYSAVLEEAQNDLGNKPRGL